MAADRREWGTHTGRVRLQWRAVAGEGHRDGERGPGRGPAGPDIVVRSQVIMAPGARAKSPARPGRDSFCRAKSPARPGRAHGGGGNASLDESWLERKLKMVQAGEEPSTHGSTSKHGPDEEAQQDSRHGSSRSEAAAGKFPRRGRGDKGASQQTPDSSQSGASDSAPKSVDHSGRERGRGHAPNDKRPTEDDQHAIKAFTPGAGLLRKVDSSSLMVTLPPGKQAFMLTRGLGRQRANTHSHTPKPLMACCCAPACSFARAHERVQDPLARPPTHAPPPLFVTALSTRSNRCSPRSVDEDATARCRHEWACSFCKCWFPPQWRGLSPPQAGAQRCNSRGAGD